jgi:hypothetical protein
MLLGPGVRGILFCRRSRAGDGVVEREALSRRCLARGNSPERASDREVPAHPSSIIVCFQGNVTVTEVLYG